MFPTTDELQKRNGPVKFHSAKKQQSGIDSTLIAGAGMSNRKAHVRGKQR
jgi:hypothetical protein